MLISPYIKLSIGLSFVFFAFSSSAQFDYRYEHQADGYINGILSCGAHSLVPNIYKGQNPVFWDYDDDGDQDLVFGESDGTLRLLSNEGSNVSPCFPRAVSTFAGIISTIKPVAPAFADANGDGLDDLFLGNGISGGRGGYVQLYYNIGTLGHPQFALAIDSIAGIDVHDASIPFPYDVDDDGDLDLFVGGGLGHLVYTENIGSPQVAVFDTSIIHLGDFGWRAAPVIADVDGDGQIELFIAHSYGTLFQYEKVNTTTDTIIWELRTERYGDIDACSNGWGCLVRPAFVDIDDDGDLDLFIAVDGLQFYRNTGDRQDPQWEQEYISYPLISGGWISSFADIDNDGLQEWFLSDRKITYYDNTGTLEQPNWELITSDYESSINNAGSITFYDIDQDGDLDRIIGYNGTSNGRLSRWWNIGTSEIPIWLRANDLILDEFDFGSFAYPNLLDIDEDGILDLFVMGSNGRLYHFINSETSQAPSWNLQTDRYLTDLPTVARRATFGDLDKDGDQDLLVSAYGRLRFYRNTGTPSAPSFTFEDDRFGGSFTNFQAPVLVDLTSDCGLELVNGHQLFLYKGIKPQIASPAENLLHDTSAVVQLMATPIDSVDGQWGGAVTENGLFIPAQVASGTHLVTYTYTEPWDCYTYTDSLYLFVAEVPTSTSQLDQAYSVNLYPNPTSGPLNLNIQGIKGDLQVKLWSIEGKMVQSLVVEGCQIDCLQSIDINNQVRGIYLLQIQSDELSIWRRVLLK